MPIDAYENFDVRMRRESARSRNYVVDAGDGKTGRFQPPFNSDRLENIEILARSGALPSRRVADTTREEEARKIGSALFPCLLNGEVLAAWNRKRETAEKRDRGLRLRICCGGAPELFDLPWEYAWNSGEAFHLAQDERTPIVRCLDVGGSSKAAKVPDLLRVLVVLSGPKDQRTLEGTQEWKRLTDQWPGSFEGKSVSLQLIEKPTAEAVNTEIERAAENKEPYHVFHFIGHGRFNEDTSEGELLFEDRAGKSDPVSALKLGNILRGHSQFRLAVLNACEGGRAAVGDPYGGVAQRLVQQGLPAAIGMQYEIPDAAALRFSESFYRAIAAGRPVEGALTAARKAMSSVDGLEWAIPVLYVRTNTSRIFTLPQAPRAKEPPRTEPVWDAERSPAPQTAPSFLVGAPLEPPTGALATASPLYVKRKFEDAIVSLMNGNAVSIAISAPGQSGRSTFLGRLREEAHQLGRKPVWLDLAALPGDSLRDAKEFFREFARQIAGKLGMNNFKTAIDQRWASVDNNITRCQECMQNLLESLPGKPRVTLLLDGADCLLGVPFRRDFFALLNIWHSERRPAEDVPWNRLDIGLATSEEPLRLGLKFFAVPLPPFTLEEATKLNEAYCSPLTDQQLNDLWKLVAGRPYLLQTCLYSARLGVTPAHDVGSSTCYPLCNELGALLSQVQEQNLSAGLKEVIERQRCSDEAVFCGLRALGIVGQSRLPVQFTCRLYSDYFRSV